MYNKAHDIIKRQYLSNPEYGINSNSISYDHESFQKEYKEKFTKVILHLFEQNSKNFNVLNFEYPYAVKKIEHYEDDKMLLYAFSETKGELYKYKDMEYSQGYILSKTDKTIESI